MPPRAATVDAVRCAATAIALALIATSVAADEAMLVRYDDDRLTVRLDGVPLDRVMAALVGETGIALRGDPPEGPPVTAQFDDLPLPTALDRLLGGRSFALHYGGDGTPRTLRLYGAGELPDVDPAPPAAPRTAAASADERLGGRPAKRLPLPQTPMLKVLKAALRQQDPARRAAARRDLVEALNGDPAVRKALRRAKPEDVVTALRAWPPGATGELLLELARGVHDRRVRDVFLQAHLKMLRQRLTRPGNARG